MIPMVIHHKRGIGFRAVRATCFDHYVSKVSIERNRIFRPSGSGWDLEVLKQARSQNRLTFGQTQHFIFLSNGRHGYLAASSYD